jgi:hypothetical protein
MLHSRHLAFSYRIRCYFVVPKSRLAVVMFLKENILKLPQINAFSNGKIGHCEGRYFFPDGEEIVT